MQTRSWNYKDQIHLFVKLEEFDLSNWKYMNFSILKLEGLNLNN